jgi:predicted ATPase
MHLGYPDRALKRSQESIALAEGLYHPHSMAFAETFAGFVLQGRGEVGAVEEATGRVIALSTEQGLTDWLAWATTLHGWAMSASGRYEDGVAQTYEGLARSRATGAELLRPYFLTLLSGVSQEASTLEGGQSALAEALSAAEKNEVCHYEAEMHRLKGELLLKMNDANAAEAQSCFGRAIEVSRTQSAKSLELRATTSLARLLAKQGKRDEAHTMLAEIYNWFTEGFDTTDLKDAKALLEELST